MSIWLSVTAYLVVALIVAGLFVDDVNDIDDVGNSTIAGVFWPIVIVVLGVLYTVAGVATLRNSCVKSWRNK